MELNMPEAIPLPSQTYLRESFDYNKDTGILFWREDRPKYHFTSIVGYRIWKSKFAGTVAGYIGSKGYVSVKLSGRMYKSHRIIWKWMTGEDPGSEIDHIDGDPKNNRWLNLRSVDTFTNARNIRKLDSNTSGVTGVHFCKRSKKWVSKIKVNYKTLYLGSFDTVDNAKAVRLEAESKYGFTGRCHEEN